VPPGVINMSRMLVLNGPRQGMAVCLKTEVADCC